MDDYLRYWWVLIPLAWFAVGGFTSFLNYRRQQKTLDVIKSYADRGQEPPEALLRLVNRPIDEEGAAIWGAAGESGSKRGGSGDGYWFSAILFGVIAAGFGYGAYTDLYGNGGSLVIVTFVLAGLSLACLFMALRAGGRPRG